MMLYILTSIVNIVIPCIMRISYNFLISPFPDTARCVRPVTFMSNMLYACSILYKMQLPFVLSFNKCDVLSCKFVRDVWMKDQAAFSEVRKVFLEFESREYRYWSGGYSIGVVVVV